MKNKKDKIILIIITILISIVIIYLLYNINIDNNKLTYFRCNDKKLGKILNEIMENYDIKHNNNKWNIYIPCGYNAVEKELLQIEINDNNMKYIFGINGCDNIVSKNNLWFIVENKYGRTNASKLLPESYVLNSRKDMKLFKKDYSNKDIYILKKNVQRKEGIKLTSNFYEIINSSKENYKIVQKYIRNLYLINGYKVNLRIYLLIVIKNNKKYFYLCNNGKCIYTNKKYNDNDFDFETNITSYNLDMSIYDKNPRTLIELSNYFKDKGINNNILFNNIKNNLNKVCVALSEQVYQSSNLNKLNSSNTSFQLFGLDYIFDKFMNVYLLEINKGPDMTPRDQEDYYMKYIVMRDMLNKVGIINYITENSFILIYNT